MKEKVDAGYTRLHITPLDPQLLKIIVPPAILPNARRISYHSLQTFPDKLYGFVDLPSADATRIKSKLHGATLRGAKINIEPARPETMPTPSPDAIMSVDDVPKPKKSKSDKKDKKRKRDNVEITGVELEDGRKVKRGWTVTSEEAQAKKKKAKDEDRKQGKPKTKDDEKKQKKRRRHEPESQFIDGHEALVKIRLPPNKMDLLNDSTGGDKTKSKKSKNRDVVVHEFENNSKFATFLKTTQATPATGREGAHFVEGKGWVNKDGTVLEEVKSTKPTTVPKLKVATMVSRPKARNATEDDDTTSSSGTSSEEDDSDAESAVASHVTKQQPDKADAGPSFVETSVASSVIESDSMRPKSSGSMRSLTIQIPPATPSPAASKVHPLEALYKLQLPGKVEKSVHNQTSADSTPFTFGGGLGDDLEDDEVQDGEEPVRNEDSQGPQIPMTPYSKQDLEWRSTRSAAPTPDTAHPSRASRFWSLGGEDDLEDVQEDEDEDGEDGPVRRKEDIGVEEADEDAIDPNTDFPKWFWKNRGNLDRSWRKRRREAAKAKRYRENKAKEDRAI
ncbi:unnamed protein product [Discula destructiva]